MKPYIEKEQFGFTSLNQKVTLYRIFNEAGSFVELLNYGCIIKQFSVHLRDGKLTNTVHGLNSIKEYEEDESCTGSLQCKYETPTKKSIISKKVWREVEAVNNSVTLTCELDEEVYKVRVRLMEHDRLVIDYSLIENCTGYLTHNICFILNHSNLSEPNEIRVFTEECNVRSNDKSTYNNGSEYKSFKILNDGVEIECVTHNKAIHPFAEVINKESDIALSLYSTMDKMILKTPNDSKPTIDVEMNSIKPNSQSRKEERTVFGFDLIYHG